MQDNRNLNAALSITKHTLILSALLLLLCASTAHAQVRTGDVAPDMLGTDRDDREVRVSAFRGKVVVVSFWASWCGYCLKELPVLEKILRAAGTERMAVVAVNYKENRRHFRRMRNRMTGTPVILTHDRDGNLGLPYEIKGLPFLVIIDKSGTVAHIHRGYGEDSLDIILESINALLTEPS